MLYDLKALRVSHASRGSKGRLLEGWGSVLTKSFGMYLLILSCITFIGALASGKPSENIIAAVLPIFFLLGLPIIYFFQRARVIRRRDHALQVFETIMNEVEVKKIEMDSLCEPAFLHK